MRTTGRTMNLELSAEQTQLRDTVRHWCAERAGIAEHVRPLLDDPTGTTAAVWQELAGLGATGVLVAEGARWRRAGMVEAGVVAEELGAGLHPGPWLSTAVTAPGPWPDWGPRIGLRRQAARRDRRRDHHHDGRPVAGDRPRADGATLHGTITALPDAAASGVLLVLADTNDEIGLFCRRSTAGRRHRLPDRTSTRRTRLFDVELDGVAAQRLGTLSAADLEAGRGRRAIVSGADALGAPREAVQDFRRRPSVRQVRRQFHGAATVPTRGWPVNPLPPVGRRHRDPGASAASVSRDRRTPARRGVRGSLSGGRRPTACGKGL